MRCPLCKADVADDNELQVHYLMTCDGFLDGQSAEEQVSKSSKYRRIELRWLKSVPTTSREIYLISSLCGSVRLEWSEAHNCFLSEPSEVLCGLHSCQLIVDGDALTTQDFEVGNTTDVVEIAVIQDGSNAAETSGEVSQKSNNLYEELMSHQILHGDSLDQLVSDGAASDNQPSTSGLSQNDVNNVPQTSDADGSEVPVTGRIPDGHDGANDESSPDNHTENNHDEEDGPMVSDHEDTDDDHSTVISQQESPGGHHGGDEVPLGEDHSGNEVPLGEHYSEDEVSVQGSPNEPPQNPDNQIIIFGDPGINISDQPNDSIANTLNDHTFKDTSTMRVPYNEPQIPETPVLSEDLWLPTPRNDENTAGSHESDNLITFEAYGDNTVTNPPVYTTWSDSHVHTRSDQMTIVDHGPISREGVGDSNGERNGATGPADFGGEGSPSNSDVGDQGVDESSASGDSGGVTGIMADGRKEGSGRSDVGSSNGGSGDWLAGDNDFGFRSTLDFNTTSIPSTSLQSIFSPTNTITTRATTPPGFTSLHNQSTFTDTFSNYKIYRPPSYKPTDGWNFTSDPVTGGHPGIDTSRLPAVEHQPALRSNTTTNTDLPTSFSQPVASRVNEVWSDNKIRELLDSLKEPRRQTTDTSAPSRQTVSEKEQVSTSAPESTVMNSDTEAVIQLREKLAEQDSYIKKLQTKYTLLKKELLRVREKEVELGKALSLAETRKVAAKEQEEIVRHITAALTRKEEECSELQHEVDELRKTGRLRQKELETTKKLHDIKVKETKKENDSLADQVRILGYSSPSGRSYKDLLERYSESVAKNASIYDQMKLLEKRNKELERKLSELKSKQRSPTRLPASQADSWGVHVTNHLTNGDTSFNTNKLDEYIGGSSVSPRSVGVVHDYSPVRDQSWRRNNDPQSSKMESTFGRYLNEPYLVRGVNDVAKLRRSSMDASVTSADVSDTDSVSHIWHNARSYSSDSISRTTSTDGRFLEGLRDATARATAAYDHVDLRGSEARRRRNRPHSFHSGFNNDTTSYTTPSVVKHHTTDLALRGYAHDRVAPSDHSVIACESVVKPCHERGKPFAPGSPQELDKGMSVLVTRACGKIGRGEVKYIGTLPTKNNAVFIGLELNKRDGKHDGQFNGRRFFKCKPDHGIFVPFSKVVMAYF